MSYNPDQLYKALEYAETGHLEGDDKWIRTQARGAGSSAYGPVQINKAALTGPGYQDIGFDEDEHNWIQNRYIPQMDLFLDYGGDDMVEGMERYDYGGRGDFTVDDRDMYNRMAKKLIAFEYKRNKGDLDSFIQSYRGKSEEEDPEYYKKVRDQLDMENVVNPTYQQAFTQ